MTIRKKATLEIQAREWLQKYQQSPDADMEHPAVQAIRDLADTGVLFNSNPAMDDLFLQMRSLAIRSGGESYERTLAIMAESVPMSESTIGRRIKRKAAVPPEIQALTGGDSLAKFLFYAAQVKLRSKHRKN